MSKTNQDRDDDSLLDEFFSEIEKLTIQDESDGREEAASRKKEDRRHSKAGDQKQPRREKSSSQKQKQKKSMIDRAETKKDNWEKFIIQEASSSPSAPTPPSALGASGRKPISFSLGVGATAKKKKNSKIARRQRLEPRSETLSLASGDETSSSPPSTKGKDQPSFLKNVLVPQWIAVLDTCAVLESYEWVCDMIQLAKDAAGASNSYYNLSDANTTRSHTFSASPQPFFVPEALTIVVPYTVWDELDYRSKEIDDEHQRYKARRAARMLTDELRNQQPEQNRQRTIGNLIAFSQSISDGSPLIIRSQSRIDSHRALEQFILPSASSKEGISNDDRILACALLEQDRLAKTQALATATTMSIPGTSVGGVVLITADKVLTGKARADHLSVYSPVQFVEHYNKRMASLRLRTNVPTGRGPTTKPSDQPRHT